MLALPKAPRTKEFNGMLIVDRGTKQNRNAILDPTLPFTFEGIMNKVNDWHLCLVHHNVNESRKEKNIKYTVKFFKDDYTKIPDMINVITQLSYPTNDREYNSDTAILMGKIPATLTESYIDEPFVSIPLKLIKKLDFLGNNDADGILCSLQINPSSNDDIEKVYYNMESTGYEDSNTVGVFEWIISDQENGKGHVYYRKTIYLKPDNNPYPDIAPGSDKDDDDYGA